MLDYEQTVNDTRAMVVVRAGDFACRLGRFDNSWINNIAVRRCNTLFGQLAGDDLLELVLEAECYEGDLSGRNGGDSVGMAMRREEGAELIVKAWSVAVIPVEDAAAV